MDSANPQSDKSGYVYLIHANGSYKIGCSKNPARRCKELFGSMPLEVNILHTIPAPDMRSAESKLHRRYKHRRVKREWFALSPDDVKEILSIKAFVLDVAPELKYPVAPEHQGLGIRTLSFAIEDIPKLLSENRDDEFADPLQRLDCRKLWIQVRAEVRSIMERSRRVQGPHGRSS